jgi:GTP cyclohydrolase IA
MKPEEQAFDEDDFNYKREDTYDWESVHKIATNYENILTELGEDVSREGLQKTPLRVSKAMHFLTQGYNIDPSAILKSALFTQNSHEMVIVKDIELYSLCEHHMLPFFGRAHIAYIPNGKITGLSKFARVVDAYSRRLQVQERLTREILDCVQESLNPLGVAVVIEAKHLCMMMRGVEKQNSVTTTSAFMGEFEKQSTRSEFINLLTSKLS